MGGSESPAMTAKAASARHMMNLRCYDSDNPGFIAGAQLPCQLCSSKVAIFRTPSSEGMPNRV